MNVFKIMSASKSKDRAKSEDEEEKESEIGKNATDFLRDSLFHFSAVCAFIVELMLNEADTVSRLTFPLS